MKVTHDIVVQRLQGRPITLVEYAGTTAGMSTFKCDKCQGVWQASVNNVTHSAHPTGCKHCAPNARVFEKDVRKHLATLQIELVRYCGTTNGHSDYRCEVCGHEWSVGYKHIQNGTGCPECARALKGPDRFTEEQAMERLQGKPFTMTRYGGMVTAISDFLCGECGHAWSTDINNITNGTGCPKCAGTLLTTEEEAWLRLEGRNISLLQYGGKASSKSRFHCDVDGCGHEWSTTLVCIVSGQGCPKCAGVAPVTFEDALARIAGRPLKMLTYAGTTRGQSTFQCSVPGCGCVWHTSASNVFAGRGCPKCGGKLPLSADDVRERLLGRPIELIEYVGNVKDKSKFKCLKSGCGNEWRTSFNGIDSGSGCPKCAKYGYKAHESADVYAYKISTVGADYIGFGITNDMKTRHVRHNLSFRKAGATGELLFSYKTHGTEALTLEKVIKQNFPIVDTGIPGFQSEAILYDDELLGLIQLGAEHAHKIYRESLTNNR